MKQSHWKLSRSLRLGLFLMGALLTGCTSLTNYIAIRNTPVASKENPVIDVGCFWQQGEGRDERGMPCRGFCGQIMFQTVGSKQPAIVNGSVAVYVFDDVGSVEEQGKPFKVYEFNQAEWSTFAHRTNLGMTYQLFIPYTRPGGREAECSLRVKYTPAGSTQPMYSHPASIALRGTSAANDAVASIDRKLMQTSPLFSQSPLLNNAMNDAANQAKLQKLKENLEQARHPATARPASPGQKPDSARLQALLNESAGSNVVPAGHEQPANQRDRVRTADFEQGRDGQPAN
jgi:hypothetical protein